MIKALAKTLLKPINATLGRAGIQLVRSGPRPFEEISDFIPFDKTIAAAKQKGLSVGDYIDAEHNRPGATQEAVDRLKAMGALRPGLDRVCEIGPGSGRYLERTIAICHPTRYEIYETASDWRKYLVDQYQVVAQPTDGQSLSHTATGSIDLVHAHKVFPGISFLGTYRYLSEMVRVTAPGGKAIFDVVTEPCMDDDTAGRWIESGAGYQCYPNLMPRKYLIDFFERHGFSADGAFNVDMRPGATECFVFTRRAD
jgi:SAM-dependent methyltransferase